MMNSELPATPTNNPEYNWLLVAWAKQTGEPQEPMCEHCGADLTGQDVIEGRYGWYCKVCAPEAEQDEPDAPEGTYRNGYRMIDGDWREDFLSDY